MSADIAPPSADDSSLSANIVVLNGECFMMFHNVLLVVHDVLHFTIYHNVLQVFHDVLLCLTMFYDV